MPNFTPGNIVVYRVGTGGAALTNAATAVFLDEYTPTGTFVQSIALPTADAGLNQTLTASGTATSEGLLTRSADGRYLLLTGYDAAPGTASITGSTSTAVNRVVGRVDAAGNIDTSNAFSDFTSGNNPRSAFSSNGTDVYMTGGAGGVRYATLDNDLAPDTSTQLSTTTVNLRAVATFDGQLYISSSSGTTRLATVGAGTPTTSGQTITNIPGAPGSLGSPYQFFFADLTTTVAGVDTLYVADDAAGLAKFSLVSGSWVANGTITGGVRGLTGTVSGSQVSLFATTTLTSIVSYVDTSGYNGMLTGTATTIVAAGTNTAFRGIAFAPGASASGATLTINDVSIAEGNSGTKTLTFTVTSSIAAGANGIGFTFATADDTATAGVDYVSTSGSGTIAAGATSTTIDVTINGDTTVELNETFFVNLTNPTGATIADAQGIGTIQNDDTTLTISDPRVVEGDAGTRTLVYTITSNAPAPAEGISFTATTADGTATAGADYVARTATGTIAAGQTSTTFSVTVNADTVIEGDETVLVNLTNATGAVIADAQGVGTIVNDDAGPTVGGILVAAALPSLQGAAATPVATNAITLVRVGSTPNPGGGAEAAESIAYEFNGTTTRIYVSNAQTGAERVDVYTVNADGSLTTAGTIPLNGLIKYGNVNSVAVKNGVVAVAYNAVAGDEPGYVALFNSTTLAPTSGPIQVGVLPDQVTFTADGTKLLVANEAQNTTSVATPGSISVIDVATGAVTATIDFAALNGQEAVLRARGLPILSGQLAGNDIEPEYISVVGTKAYVTLQEVNAVAVIDLTTNMISAIQPLGGVDHALAGNLFDPSDRDGAGGTTAINLVNAPVTSLLQPDAIATYTVNGVTYFVTANEGDARAYAPNDADVGDVVRLSSAGYVLDPTAFPNAAALKADASLGRLQVLNTFGDTDGDGDFDQIYAIGGRGFSIVRDNGDGTFTKVRESGGEFESILARDYASIFNTNQILTTPDSRSDDKGPEPEGVTTGAVGGRTYAFIGLERVGGVMIYDITDPANASFVGFAPPTAADLGPETLIFIPAAQSPTGTPLLATANEVSGTVTLYRVAVPQNGSLSIAASSLTEGDSGSANMTFTVTRSGGTDGAVSASYAVTNGTTDAADFGGALPTGTVNFAAGQSTATVLIPVAGDTVYELDETFTVTLSAPQGGATLATAAATGTILNNDAAPTISIGNTSVTEGDTGTTTLIYTITSSAPAAAGGITFSIATGGGTATPGTDYVAQSTTGTIAAGQTSTTFSVTVNNDTVYEPNETVVVTISNPTNATIATGQGTGTIINNDPIPSSARIFATDFTGFTAAGFAPTPTAGQLDSDVWRVVGLSDNPNPDYGFTGLSGGDFGRGTISTTDPVTAGVYSPLANPALVIQPTSAELDVNGFIEARIQNGSGLTATSFTIAFDWSYRNSGARASNMQLSYSTDGTNFTIAPAASFTTPSTADTTLATIFTLSPAAATLTGLTVGDGGYLFLRWTHLNSTGGGNRDEVGIDNLTVDASLSTVGVFTIADATQAEGNSGTTNFIVTVTRTTGIGAASVNFATADGTAIAGSDYTAQSGTLNFADGETSKTITVLVTGDTRNEASETFFVNLSNPVGATLPDAQGRFTIGNDDTGPVGIYDIQGRGHRSSFEGTVVSTMGIVTAVDSNGFYLQDPFGDSDLATSDGIFVFTSSAPTVAVGNAINITGTVTEFTGTTAGSLSLTQLTAPTITLISAVNALPAAVVIAGDGTGDRTPPTSIIDNDRLTSYDPLTDGIDFYESLEGMRVTIRTPLVVGNTNSFGETYVVASAGVGATGITSHGGIAFSAGDDNPEKIQIDDDSGVFAGYAPNHSQGDVLGDVTGIINYAFAEYELVVTAPVTVTTDVTQARETSTLTGDAFNFTYASFNVENLAPVPDSTVTERNTQQKVDAAFATHAREIVSALNSPDIIGLQEIQDADGIGTGTDYTGTATANKLIAAIIAAGGPAYTYVEVAPTANNTTGGEPNGNIRNGYLYNAARVGYVAGSARLLEDPAYTGSRKPLLAEFTFNGQVFTAANVHSTSRGGSDPLFGANQPPTNAGDASRTAQAAALKGYIDGVLATDPAHRFVVNGDFNGFYYETAIQTLTAGNKIVDLYTRLPVNERYSYYFGGNYQTFDYVLVSSGLAANAQFDVVHYNAGFTDGLSATDHDQALARIRLVAPATSGNDVITGTDRGERFDLSAGGNDTVNGGGGSDGFYVGTALDSGDRIDGGVGDDDQVIIQGNATGGAAIVLNGLVLTNVETLAIQPGNDARFGDTSGALYSYNITLSDENVANNAVLIVNSNRLRVGENLTFNGSAETGGAFWFYSGAGNDTLIGGGGADRFFGRLGADTLTGGGGNDVFYYYAANESTAASRDRITDFTVGDQIDLSYFDANATTAGTNDAFQFIGTAAFSAAGQVRVFSTDGTNWIVEANIDGDLGADMTIAVTTTGGHALVATDFIL